MLREAVETPGRTAALVTPDRVLARRVAARLAVWDLDVEDTAGQPFAKTIPGALLDLVAAAVEKEFEPVALMTLLKHPLCRLGMAAERDAQRDAGAGAGGIPVALLRQGPGRAWRPRWRGAGAVLAACGGAAASGPPTGRRRAQLVRRLARRVRAHGRGASRHPKPASLHALARLHFETAQALARTQRPRRRQRAAPGRGRRMGGAVLRQPDRSEHARAGHGRAPTTPTSIAPWSPRSASARAGAPTRASPSAIPSRRGCSRPTW